MGKREPWLCPVSLEGLLQRAISFSVSLQGSVLSLHWRWHGRLPRLLFVDVQDLAAFLGIVGQHLKAENYGDGLIKRGEWSISPACPKK